MKPIDIEKSSFQKAVEDTEEIATAYKTGLGAMTKKYKAYFNISADTQIGGSVDIDEATQPLYPNENRWDYAFDCEGSTYFVEVHTAHTTEVSTVIKKLEWLKRWLREKAPALKKLAASQPYYWVASDNIAILKNSSQARKVAQNGIYPIRQWDYAKIKKQG